MRILSLVSLVALVPSATVNAADIACSPVLYVRDVDKALAFWKEKLGIELSVDAPLPVELAGREGFPSFPSRGAVELCVATDARSGFQVLFVKAASAVSDVVPPRKYPTVACIRLPALARVRAAFPDAPIITAGAMRFLSVEDPDGNSLCIMESLPTAKAPAPPPASAAIELFNGKDLTGWHVFRQGVWKVEDGVLVGEQGPEDGGGWLLSDADHENFTLSLSFRISSGANSGVCVRYPGEGAPPKTGCEIQFCEVDPKFQTGSIFDFQAAPRDVYREGWNEAVIEVDGTTVTSRLNGKEVARAKLDHLKPAGQIGFQIHAGAQYAGTRAEFKAIRVIKR